MGTALRRRNIVDKTERRFVVGIIVLHGHFHVHVVLHALAVDHVVV